MFTTRLPQRGFTLIELIIFIVVVSIGMVGILGVMNTTVKSSADPMVRKQALAIAESLLDEIVQKEYGSPNFSCTAVAYPSTGWSRALFDCVDDYKGFTVSGVTDAAGSPVTALAAYSIFPAVAISDVQINSQWVKKVVVSVTGPQGVIALTGYRGNY
jgi:MSHA pilin protein MshD